MFRKINTKYDIGAQNDYRMCHYRIKTAVGMGVVESRFYLIANSL